MRSRTAKIDLTEGPIWKKLLSFFLPVAAGTCMQQLYNAADGLIVAKFVGTEALASVGGSTAQIINVLIGFFVALTSGASVIIAQFYGARRHEDVRRAAGSALIVCTIIALGLTAFGLLLSRPMLSLMNTPADTIDGADLYLKIYFGGVIFILILNMESNVLRAVGNSTDPFIYMLAACVSNIIMDYVFVRFFGWGIAGVAIATVLAQVINAALLSRRLFTTKEDYRLRLSDLKLHKKFNKQMLGLGIPAGCQSSMYAISNMIVQIGVNGLGTLVVASWAMSGKVDGIFWAVSGALGTSITTFVGQNYGAGLQDRVRGCVKQGMIISSVITICISTGIMTLGTPILNILTDDPDVVVTTYRIMTYFVPYYIVWTMIEVISGVLRGMGDVVRPVIIVILGIGVLRIAYVLGIYPIFGTLEALSAVYVISWAVTGVALVIYYILHQRSLKRRQACRAAGKA